MKKQHIIRLEKLKAGKIYDFQKSRKGYKKLDRTGKSIRKTSVNMKKNTS